jgi:predicted neuraminidase
MLLNIRHIFLCIAAYSWVLTVYGQTRWIKVSEQLLFSNPPFKSCHASTIVEDKYGGLLVACFGGTGEGKKDVGIFLRRISADREVSGREVADGVVNDSLRFPCWNPVLLKKRDGQLVLFYKIGPSPREWWGVYKTSDDNGESWSVAHPLPRGMLGPIKDKPLQFPDGSILCPSSVELPAGHWKVQMEKTDESLKKWEAIPVDTNSRFDVIQPSILQYPKNRMQILCRSKQGNIIESWSNDSGKTWSALSKTTLPNPNSGIDAVTLKDGRQLLVYNPAGLGNGSSNDRSELRVAVSTDGEHWQDIMDLENGTTEEYSYPAIIQTSDGLIHITYTYDRKNIKHVVIRGKRSSF